MDTSETISKNKELDDGRIMMNRHELSSGGKLPEEADSLRYFKSIIYIGAETRAIPR